jgi:DNA-directed RNA polymerase beta subunit
MSSSSSASSSSVEPTLKTFPIVENRVIRTGEKVPIKIPRRTRPAIQENETTQMIKRDIESRDEFVRMEDEKRSKLVESIMLEHSKGKSGGAGIHIDELRAKIQREIDAITTTDGRHVLDHLGDYVEEPYTIIESYFADQHLSRLVRHQIESYNHFINYQAGRTIKMFNPLKIHSDKHMLESGHKLLEIEISFDNFKMYPPQIHENNGATKTMLPQEAKLRNFTYASNMTVDVHIRYIIRDGEDPEVPRIIEKTLPKKINIGKMPIMLKSSICVLTQNQHIPPSHTGECPLDCGGYFIIKGSEKTVLGQERAAENRIYCFDGKNTTKWSWFAEIKSVPDYKCISPKQLDMMIASKNNGFGRGIYVMIPRFKLPIELFALYRALGVLSDKEICQHILLNIDDPKQAEMLAFLEASIIDGNKYPTQEESLRHIVSMVAFTPINMDKDTGAKKKREFAIEVLGTDLLPHCRTLKQKLYLLGTMATKLIQTSLGWLPPDDRDSYVNKRIELTGTLLNNLFRNYFNKLVKEMQKKIVSEINTGSWRTSSDYENIITMNNIYKIMKTTTIENGISRALSTGDFSIKQSNSSKVGVGQVANRLTYLGTLSHLRRINTPLEKSGELIDPRKLHGTTWGFLCPAETPEGQSIGVVKNISYMAHITIPTNSASLYEYVEPSILKVDDATSPLDLHDKVKVYVNGIWLGVADDPERLYAEMKDKKHRGIINIYTSIVFNYKAMEIRICNDGGRLTRPVLRVKDGRALLTPDIVRRVGARELSWNDLLTNCRIPESVIEYIDPEEQNYSMVAMKSKNAYLQTRDMKINYTHCEIHPSTIFGVLASCIPFPEHNQAPRNTYQCLGVDEFVWMANGTKKAIKDVKIGDIVLSFNPDSLDITSTPVVNHFIRPNEFPIYRLKTTTGREITATEDHKFMTNLGWKTVKEIMETDGVRIGITMMPQDTAKSLVLDPVYRYSFKVAEYLRFAKNAGAGSIPTIREWMDNLEERNGFLFIPFAEIKREPDGLISDIEVESDNHSFIASSGFASSNCAMGKQAIGIYCTNYDQRMDKTAYVLTYPSRPLVDTRLMNFIHLNKIPSGSQIYVAIMTHTGYNQEDSVLINKGSIDRGLFMATIYHTEKDEDNNVVRDEIKRCKPNPAKTKGIKFGNYDKLNAQGFIPENTLVENRDVIIAKVVPIKENRNDPTKTVKFEDQSKTYRTTEESYVDKNYTGRNGDGYDFAKVRVRTLRKPVLGDKFCALPSQQVLTDKGWIAMIDLDPAVHKVCTLNTDGKLHYEHPLGKCVFDHDSVDGDDEPLYHIENKQVEITCTMNHKLYVQTRPAFQHNRSFELMEAREIARKDGDVKGKQVRFQKTMENVYPDIETIRIGDVDYNMDAWLQLLGMFVSDGNAVNSNSSIIISVYKERKVEFATACLTNLGVHYTRHSDGRFHISCKKTPAVCEHLKELSVGAFNKYLPDYVWNLSQKQSIVLLEALLQGDGTTMKYKGEDEFSRYCTISPRLADDVSRLALHCGWSGTVKISEEPTGVARVGKRNIGARAGEEVSITLQHTYYKVSIIREQNQPWINKKSNESNKETRIPYKGKVYCIEMESSHVYYMRESQTSPSLIIGNSSRVS